MRRLRRLAALAAPAAGCFHVSDDDLPSFAGSYTASLDVWSADTSVSASTVVLAEQLPGPSPTP